MSDIVIAQGIGKLYRLGTHATAYNVLRERIGEMLRAPFRRREPAEAAETFWALKDVGFNVGEAEVVGLIGKNGAGKSTLLKILSRITEPTEGQIDLYGRVASLLEVGIGFHPELSGRENIFLNGAILGMPRSETRRKFDEIVEFAGVAKFLDTPVKRYSSGMYVRLAFAVAAHLEPDILIVDEVLAVGDAAFQQKCLGKMRSIRSEGRTVIVVSHSMATVTALCERVIWLSDGTVKATGPTKQIVARYLNEGVRDEFVWQPRHASHHDFEYHSVSVTAAGTETSEDSFPADATIEVLYDFTVVHALSAARLLLEVRNDLGETLFTSSSADGSGQRMKPMRQGRQQARCRIPGNLLRAGRYSISVNHPYSTYEVMHENIITFSINEQNGGMEDGREGKIAPLLEWGWR
jgi:lipopolysaccharide transport system ATP-binding protein